MNKVKVNIIGAGLAGLSAARRLAQEGVACRLVSMQPSERAQSVLAEGGMNAVLDTAGENDTVEEHFADTMKGGVFLADPNAVWGFVNGAPGIIDDLLSLGVPFQMDQGRVVQRYFGGQKKRRTAFAKSSTGKVLITALTDAVRAFEVSGEVERLPHHELTAFDIVEGTCRGVLIRDIYSGTHTYLSGPVLLCSGSMGGMFGTLTTGTTQNTGDVTALAYDAGVELGNLEFIQYHPTTIPITGKRMLISEAARGEGGRLWTMKEGKRWYFMEEKYPELGNLMPRDVVSREEFAVIRDNRCDGLVRLDLTGIPTKDLMSRLSDMRDECLHYFGKDIAKEPLIVEPGIHYFMGGILVDEQHRTNIAGLYAAGECACQYHGANRLGGNSTMGAVYGGLMAAASAKEDVATFPEASETPVAPVLAPGASASVLEDNEVQKAMEQALCNNLGIVRCASEMEAGLAALRSLDASAVSLRQKRRLQLAEAFFAAALARCESRGAHCRSDYPETLEEFRKTTVISKGADGPQVSFRGIPERRS